MRTVILLIITMQLSGCLVTMDPRCRSYDYCAYTDSPRQYIRAPDGWGGKYCLNNPEEC